MKFTDIALVGGGIWAVYHFANLGVAANVVQIVLDGVQIKGFANYVITLKIQNVSNAIINVNSAVGNVLINGNQLASFSDFSKRSVGPNSEQRLDVNVSPDFLSLPGVVKQLIQSGGTTVKFTIEGNANVNGLVLPFTLDQQVGF